MTIDERQRTQLTRSALSEHDQQLLDVLCQLYQSLADAYHRSEAYQRMVVLYPTLATAIERCRHDGLVPSRSTPLLWERSHGDPGCLIEDAAPAGGNWGALS